VKCASPVEKEDAKICRAEEDDANICRASGGAENGEEKRNVLIVSVSLPIAIDLALRSNMQRRVDVVWVSSGHVARGG
jgi:hypothetical protein